MIKSRSGWQIIGPGGAGSHYIPTISPHDSDTVLTCSDMTGAYITHDNGASWRQFNLRIRVDSFAFDPIRPGIIYAGSTGLFRSADNGENWELILPRPEAVIEEVMVGDEADNRYITDDGWPGGKVQAVFVDPEQSGHIYAGINTKATLIDAGNQDNISALSIYCSFDDGCSWTFQGQVKGGRIFGFHADTCSPRNNRIIYVLTDNGVYKGSIREKNFICLGLPEGVERASYAACGISPETGGPVFYLSSPTGKEGNVLLPGVWKSVDRGLTWKRKTCGIEPVLENNGITGTLNAGLIGTSANNAGTVYLTVKYHVRSGGNGAFGIYKSEDEGESWKCIYLADKYNNAANHRVGWVESSYTAEYSSVGPKGNGFIGIGVSHTNPEICYVSDMGAIHRTIDGGKNWDQVYTCIYPDGSCSNRGGLEVTTCYGLHFDPFDNRHMVVSYTDMGMAYSCNEGKSWFHAIKGVPPKWSNTCYWMVFDPDVKGRAWSAWAYSHDLPRAKMFDSMDELRNSPGGVCRSENGAQTWEVSCKGMPEGPATHIILDLSSPVGERTLYTAVFGRGVYKSVDDGHTWEQKNNGLGQYPNAYRFTMLPDGTLYLIAARAKKQGAEYGGAIFKSSDGAESWQEIRLPDGVNAPNNLEYDPVNTKRMYLACWPETVNEREYYGGVYLTADGGLTWNCIFDQTCHAYAVTVDAYDSRIIYVVTFDSSIYRSEDKGRTWQRLGGYNFKWGHRVINDPSNRDMIYVTTYGSSIWYGPAAGTGNQPDELG